MGVIPHSCIMALVMDAGVGHPVGVSDLTGILVIAPCATSSASRIGVNRVFSGVGPAPEIPGTRERSVFARMLQNSGFFESHGDSWERKGIWSVTLPIVFSSPST